MTAGLRVGGISDIKIAAYLRHHNLDNAVMKSRQTSVYISPKQEKTKGRSEERPLFFIKSLFYNITNMASAILGYSSCYHRHHFKR